jgi:hypothetical protein
MFDSVVTTEFRQQSQAYETHQLQERLCELEQTTKAQARVLMDRIVSLEARLLQSEQCSRDRCAILEEQLEHKAALLSKYAPHMSLTAKEICGLKAKHACYWNTIRVLTANTVSSPTKILDTCPSLLGRMEVNTQNSKEMNAASLSGPVDSTGKMPSSSVSVGVQCGPLFHQRQQSRRKSGFVPVSQQGPGLRLQIIRVCVLPPSELPQASLYNVLQRCQLFTL